MDCTCDYSQTPSNKAHHRVEVRNYQLIRINRAHHSLESSSYASTTFSTGANLGIPSAATKTTNQSNKSQNACDSARRGEPGEGALTVIVGGRKGFGQDEELEEEAGGGEKDRQPVAAHLLRNRHWGQRGR